MDHALRHGQRAVPDVDRPPQGGDRIERAPAPVGGARQPLDGLGGTDLTSLARTEQGAEFVPLPLGAGHSAQAVPRQGCGMLRDVTPPRQHGMRVHPNPPSHGADAQACGQRSHGPPPFVDGDVLAGQRRALELLEIAEAGTALQLTPWGAARGPVGADVAASPPTVVGTIQVWTALLLAVNGALAAPCLGDPRRWRTRCLVTGCCGLFTGGTQRFVEQPGKGLGLARAFRSGWARLEERWSNASARARPQGMQHATQPDQGNQQELIKQKVCGHGGGPSDSGIMRGSYRFFGALELSVL
jgi:hypothetical protein